MNLASGVITFVLCLVGPMVGLALRTFGQRMLSVVGKDDGRDSARDLAGVVEIAFHLVLLYIAITFGSWGLFDIEFFEALLCLMLGAAFAVLTFFGLRRLQQWCSHTFGDFLGGALTPAAVRGIAPLFGLISYGFLCPISEELFYRRLLLNRIYTEDFTSLVAAHAISGILCFSAVGLSDGVWNVIVIRLPFSLLLTTLFIGGGFGASFLAHTVHNLAEVALILGSAHLAGKGE